MAERPWRNDVGHDCISLFYVDECPNVLMQYELQSSVEPGLQGVWPSGSQQISEGLSESSAPSWLWWFLLLLSALPSCGWFSSAVIQLILLLHPLFRYMSAPPHFWKLFRSCPYLSVVLISTSNLDHLPARKADHEDRRQCHWKVDCYINLEVAQKRIRVTGPRGVLCLDSTYGSLGSLSLSSAIHELNQCL